MEILIVDDSETSQLLLTTVLSSAGYAQLHSATSYETAHDTLIACLEGDRCIDLILMDINMPGVDGIEATKRIKADPELARIPIIIVTGVEEEDRIEAAFEAGANDYIRKPISRIELLARVRSAIRLRDEMEKRRDRERELEDLTEELRELSNVDGLTSLGNRRWFDERIANEWLRGRREGASLALLMADIDFFKRYNDSMGHLEGDNCLKQVARTIRDAARRPADFAARFGGEEFVLLMPHTDLEGAKHVAEGIMQKLAELAIKHPDSDIGPHVTLSIGVATAHPDMGLDQQTLVAAADKALYRAKNSGRNRVETETA